jgi:hypothetical protein
MATYDPRKVIVTVGTAEIVGFAGGTFIEVERQTDAANLSVGTKGEYAWGLSADRSATITLTLLQTSQSNDILQAMATADEKDGSGARSFGVQDLGGRTLASALEVRVRKVPNLIFGAEVEAGNREWVLLAGRLDITVGGSLT